ncbi:hypothetical protein [Streptomyces chrestomyceticus]
MASAWTVSATAQTPRAVPARQMTDGDAQDSATTPAMTSPSPT